MDEILTLNPPDPEQASERSQDTERDEAVSWVRQQIAAAVPIVGTAGERYLVEHRGLRGPWPDALRWSGDYRSQPDATPRTCILAAVTDSNGGIVALQSIEIDAMSGAKSQRTDKPKLSRGPVGEGAVFLGSEFEDPSTMVLGEGIETTLTRCLVGPCDAHACLGNLRFIEPQKHHKRVEVLADTNAREGARRLARQYADLGLAAYVVTVPESLGPKADLNDALRDLGSTAVLMAVEDAERFTKEPTRQGLSNFELNIGSDIEIAQKLVERLEELYGPVVVADGRFWRFDRTHWSPLDDDHLVRFIHRADGATYLTTSGSLGVVKLSKSRVASIFDAATKYKRQPDFFASPPSGINCENGFIQIDATGAAALVPHARRWRQRHVVRGRWFGPEDDGRFEKSLLAKYLNDVFQGDEDGEAKNNLLAELAGATALGCGTRLRNPKAAVAFSEEGATGKSAFLKMLRALPNPDAVASVPPGKFGDEKYCYRLIGKVLNAADELSEHAVKADVFKRMITGEPVPARDVYRSAVDFTPTALHVFSTNVLPKFSGGVDGGVVRRLLPLEFTHVVPEGERDEDLHDKIVRDEADLLLNFAVAGACRLMRQRDFTIPPSSRELLQRWLLEADPVRGWAAARLEKTEYEHLVAIGDLYIDFVAWALGQGMKHEFLPNAISFGRRLRTAVPGLKFHRSDGSFCQNAKLRSGV